MTTRWLVDGMNVVGSRPDGWWRDRHRAVGELVERLVAFAEATGEPVVVVFDGRRPGLVEGGEEGVEVGFAPGPGPGRADEEIVRRVGADPDPTSLTVVTSDVGLADRVRRYGAQVVPAGSFRARLDRL
jgi:predicted RNA-binding protein with PIN domain